MNRCKHCGKEIAEGYQFCSRSCAAKFNNARRERKPWTEEQHLKNRRKQVPHHHCKYCGRESESLICTTCKPYVQNIKAFDKLGIRAEGTLEDRFNQMIDMIQTKYYGENKGLIGTARELGLNQTTVRFALKKAGLVLRSIPEGQRVAIEEGRMVTPESPRFISGTHISWEGHEYRFRSSWEEQYMKTLDEQQIRYVYEFGWIRYWNSRLGCEKLAKPDFYLPDSGEIVELKSAYTLQGVVQDMKDKFKRYRELGFKPKLILDWKEIDIESLEE